MGYLEQFHGKLTRYLDEKPRVSIRHWLSEREFHVYLMFARETEDYSGTYTHPVKGHDVYSTIQSQTEFADHVWDESHPYGKKCIKMVRDVRGIVAERIKWEVWERDTVFSRLGKLLKRIFK